LSSRAALAAALAALVALCAAAGASAAQHHLPPGFIDRTVLAGLQQPTSVAFADDGRVVAAEKRGLVLAYSSRSDPTPRRIADLRREVHSFDERGLMALTLDPAFPRRPFIYVAYTVNAPVGVEPPVWPSPPRGDACFGGSPDPAFKRGCTVSGRVSRLRSGTGGKVRAERVLLNDWCQVYPSHSVGDLAFDRTGALIASAGDGAYFYGIDTGGRGKPANPCGDPPGEGGALRAQDLRSPGDPLSLDGTVVRIDPATGLPAAGNPLPGAGNDGRIIAYGLRNPFRFALRPGTDEIWIGDVGWIHSEEVDQATTDHVTNFGWPCYEGRAPQPSYARLGTGICGGLYADGTARRPFLSYPHGGHVAEGEDCPASPAAAISGVAFDRGARFPWPLDGALLFADYVRGCIWAIPPGRFGHPRHGAVRVLESSASAPIDLEPGPGGLYYVDLIGGAIHEISYEGPTSELRLRTRPRGFRVAFDERVEADGTAVTVRTGSPHRVAAPLRQRRDERTFRVSRWSDGAARSHRIQPSTGATLSAVYRCTRGCGKGGGG
jgi:glucose/arabinose dehydrogenase